MKRNKRVWASYIKMKLPGHLFWHFQRISWIVLDWISPPPPPPPLSLSWRTFAEVAKPSCPAPVADTTKMGVLMVFAKKKFEITFPRFTRQQKRCKRCKVHRQDAWSVRTLSRKANEVFGHWLFDTPIWVWLKNIYVPKLYRDICFFSKYLVKIFDR